MGCPGEGGEEEDLADGEHGEVNIGFSLVDGFAAEVSVHGIPRAVFPVAELTFVVEDLFDCVDRRDC